jgi:uncharacterized protein (TIGR03435 family)
MKLFLILVFCGSAFAQAPSEKVTFEVATINQVENVSIADLLRRKVAIDDTFATLPAQTPIELIQRAYGVAQDQIQKVPDASRGIYFDVKAKIPAGVSKDRVPEMLQALLAERFKLVVHRQAEARPIYELAVAPGGVKKMQPSSGTGPGRCPLESGHHVCHAMTLAELATQITNLRLLARGAQSSPAGASSGLADVATNALADYLIDRPVFDKTGVDGRFEFVFDYGPVAGAPDVPPVRMKDSLTALGLTLVPVNTTSQTVVIDHMERLPIGQ